MKSSVDSSLRLDLSVIVLSSCTQIVGVYEAYRTKLWVALGNQVCVFVQS